MLIVGHKVFKDDDHISITQRLPFASNLVLPFNERYQDEGTSRFERKDEAFYVSLNVNDTGQLR